ncbi:hypothetical protein BU24DRAFT_428650 [Aaosphaeria arxii CBS 175.79]|uniref:Uncharacterized protein n=1 Tax=Aaosphaeria arxii CBS 175.79 TaxID=1450172 RepID=A0A6A5XA90_9PLEO|nr:uncharacterized protein BU24DRAFT_428650 [Aaosphaeria arxii CBS 175.79]KAF2009776.1 hypothetical protein BU24DRAFT_428650 [Aaosphaeria arxii CBS 175.79]
MPSSTAAEKAIQTLLPQNITFKVHCGTCRPQPWIDNRTISFGVIAFCTALRWISLPSAQLF